MGCFVGMHYRRGSLSYKSVDIDEMVVQMHLGGN